MTDERCLHQRTEVEDTWSSGVIEVCVDCRARRKRVVQLVFGTEQQARKYPWVSAGEQVKRALVQQGRDERVAAMVIKTVTIQGRVTLIVIDDPIEGTK